MQIDRQTDRETGGQLTMNHATMMNQSSGSQSDGTRSLCVLADNNNLHNQHHNATRQAQTHTGVGGGGSVWQKLLANVKNKISTRVGEQNNLINGITFSQKKDVPGNGKVFRKV